MESHQRKAPPGSEAIPALIDWLDHFQHRVRQDAMAEATAAYWNRRAEAFEKVGNARCDETARACRNAATLAIVKDAAYE